MTGFCNRRSGKYIRLFVLFLLFTVSLTGRFTYGAESSPVTPQEPEPIKLSLQEALLFALDHNLDIRVNVIEQKKTGTDVQFYKGEFDPVISANVPFNKQTQLTATTLQASIEEEAETVINAYRQEIFDFAMNFTKKFSIGGIMDVDFGLRRFDTTVLFYNIDPSFPSNLSFSYRQPLLKNFGRDVNRRNIVISQNNMEISGHQFKQQVIDALNDVQSRYWDLVFMEQDYKSKEEALDLALKHLERNRIQVDIGTLAPIEISQSKYNVAQREEDIIRAEAALDNARDRLKAALNVAASDQGWDVLISAKDYPTVPGTAELIDLDEAIETALKNRPDFQQQKIDILNRTIIQKYQRNQTLPDLEFQASYGWTGLGGDLYRTDPETGDRMLVDEGGLADSFDRLFSGDYPTWRIGLNVSYPIFNNAAKASRARAELDLHQAMVQQELLKQQIIMEVREAARAIESNRKGYDKAKQAMELAEEQLNAEQRKFEVGTSTNFQVLEYQRELTGAATNEVAARIEYIKSTYYFEKVLGTFLDECNIQIK